MQKTLDGSNQSWTGVRVMVLALMGILMSACASTTTSLPPSQFSGKLPALRRVVLLPPEVEASQITAGGLTEKQNAASSLAANNISAGLRWQFPRASGAQLQTLRKETLPDDLKANLTETQALFDKVLANMMTGQKKSGSADKFTRIDHSLGPEVRLLDPSADALLLVRAVDHSLSGGRKAVKTAETLMGLAAAGFLGVGFLPSWGGGTFLAAALVNAQTGDVVWYKHVVSPSAYNLRDPESAQQLVETLLADFPRR